MLRELPVRPRPNRKGSSLQHTIALNWLLTAARTDTVRRTWRGKLVCALLGEEENVRSRAWYGRRAAWGEGCENHCIIVRSLLRVRAARSGAHARKGERSRAGPLAMEISRCGLTTLVGKARLQ